MSKEKESSCTTAISELATLLTIIFIVLKLVNAGDVGHWSWWWVLSPVWILIAFVIVVGILIGIFNND